MFGDLLTCTAAHTQKTGKSQPSIATNATAAVAVVTAAVAAVVVATAAVVAAAVGMAVMGDNEDNHNNQLKLVAATATAMEGNDNNKYKTIN